MSAPGARSRPRRKPTRSSPAPSSRSSRVASSSTSACAGSSRPRWSRCGASVTCSPTWAASSRRRSSSWTRTATTSSSPAASGWSRPSPRSAASSSTSSPRARSGPASAPRSSTSGASWTWGGGQVRTGVVSSVVNFGAFVDLGGVDGLVHVSELSWKHIDHPSEVVEVGQEVTVEVLDVDLDRERVSLSLKATQEDPWRQFARTHQIGQVVPGKVTKLVPFGAFVRVDEGIEGLVHISELAERHVEIPEQVVQVGDEILVKVIDIDLDRRRISLSLKQANEGVIGDEEQFDPTLYGMAAEYDEQGNYKYPEGFDPETNEWLEGFESQREQWERQYAEAHARWEAHRTQIEEASRADHEAREGGDTPTSYSSETSAAAAEAVAEDAGGEGTLASDEALAALREKLTG